MSSPDWDFHQLEVILECPSAWQLVIAGPGAGKTAVACQRIAYLVDEGVAASRILLISFTRTAIAELRDRILTYSVSGRNAQDVRISTIDSQAWTLRSGYDAADIPIDFKASSYELNIERAVELIEDGTPDLVEFLESIEHLIIDEAQDVIGPRADLVMEVLKHLSDSCGVTILADPVQAIYGFTSDSDGSESEMETLLTRLENRAPRSIIQRELKEIHRIKTEDLRQVFIQSRQEAEKHRPTKTHIEKVQETIRECCRYDLGDTSYENIASFLAGPAGPSTLVLFRRRADALIASSYCSSQSIEHRLRLSGLPPIVRPWLGWVFQDAIQGIVDRAQFDALWTSQAQRAAGALTGETRDDCWTILRKLASSHHGEAVDIVYLRTLASRSRPPLELVHTEFGRAGPILGSIHASKGREADTVMLIFPSGKNGAGNIDEKDLLEEGRVYYVGATRARQTLAVAALAAPTVGYLDSGRIFRKLQGNKVQIEIGREGDVSKTAHLSWSNAIETQLALARLDRTSPGNIRDLPEHGYDRRVVLEWKGPDGVRRFLDIGEMSDSFQIDISRLWKLMEGDRQKLRPCSSFPYVFVVGATTVALTESERFASQPPFNRSGFALAPVVKGFSLIQFLFRK